MTRTLSILMAFVAPLVTQAQEYPTKSIRAIVSFAPGGVVDTSTRIVTAKLQETLNWHFVVDNRPGANGFIGAAAAAKANADGYTLLSAHTGELAVNPVMFKTMPYDENTFAPVIMLSDAPMLIVVNINNAAINSIKDLVAAAKAKPGVVNFGSPGTGSVNHMASEWFAAAAGANRRIPCLPSPLRQALREAHVAQVGREVARRHALPQRQMHEVGPQRDAEDHEAQVHAEGRGDNDAGRRVHGHQGQRRELRAGREHAQRHRQRQLAGRERNDDFDHAGVEEERRGRGLLGDGAEGRLRHALRREFARAARAGAVDQLPAPRARRDGFALLFLAPAAVWPGEIFRRRAHT